MGGLNVREITIADCLKNKDFRIDSNFYTMLPYHNPYLEYERIGDCLISSQYGMSIAMNEEGIGVPIYRMNEIHNLMCDLDVNKCAKITLDELATFKLHNRDVLFNRTNSYEWVGRTGLYYQNDDVARVFASYLVRLTPDTSKILPEFLVAFLNSKYGIWDIKRRARQSVNQTNVNPEEVKEIEIPILSKEVQLSIAEKFNIANKNRVLAKRMYEDAESYLLDSLGLAAFAISPDASNIKSIKESFLETGRFDSEYYLPKFEDYSTLIWQYSGGADTIGNICEVKEQNFTPDASKEYRYIELANVGNSGEITGHSTQVGKELPSRARRIVHAGDVVISSLEGSIDSCALIPKDYDGALCSTGFYVVKSSKLNPETLLTLFKSLPVQQLMIRGCSGAIMSAISRTELDKIPLPLINREIQDEIAKHVQRSFALRKESEKLLQDAKALVEDAIANQITN